MYTKEQVEAVCIRIEEGESLSSVLRERGYSKGQFFRTIDATPELADRYTRAMDRRAELYAAEIVDISDNPDIPSDQKRIMVDSRKWVACKLIPKKYGDRQTISVESIPTDKLLEVLTETE